MSTPLSQTCVVARVPAAWLVAALGVVFAVACAPPSRTAERSSSALSIAGLFTTGVDANGAALPSGSVDPHYVLSSTDTMFPGPHAIVVATGAGTPPAWTPDTTTAAWIGVESSGMGNVTTYVFETTFSLVDVDPATASLAGSVAFDDSLTILLNGNTSGVDLFGYGSLHDFTIPSGSGFVAGTNELFFRVVNTQGSTGLDVVSLTGTATCTGDASCLSGEWCDDGTCETQLANGAAIPTVPSHTSPTLDGTCTTSAAVAVCRSGVCDSADDKCGYADGDGTCTQATAAAVCRSTRCSAGGACVGPTGCDVDADCASAAWCRVATHTCEAKVGNGGAVPTDTGHADPVLDGICTAPAAMLACASAVCDATDNACGYANGDGPCTAATAKTVCRSGLCGDATCIGPAPDLSSSGPDLSTGVVPSIGGDGIGCAMAGRDLPSSATLVVLVIGALALRRARRFFFILVLASGASVARADDHGFAVGRYEPTPAGQWSFFVDHPWYSSTRYVAAGLTLDYAHDPLASGTRTADGSFHATSAIIEHALLAHVDVAGSFLDRVGLSASLPVTLVERGQAFQGAAPIAGVAAGDVRLGATVRLWRQPDRDALSFHVGGYVWIPVGTSAKNAGDGSVRVLPKLTVAGYARHVRWSTTAAFLYRPLAVIGSAAASAGNTVGSELQLAASLQYAGLAARWAIGPEAQLATIVAGGHAWRSLYTSLELLLGAHYSIVEKVQVGLAVGFGVLHEPGTPDARVLLRVAYAPIRGRKAPRELFPDRDHDGVRDDLDACPDRALGTRADPTRPGCPMGDRDRDGVLDGDDVCIDEVPGDHPDPLRRGCPAIDSDGDGIFDPDDACPLEPMGTHPDKKRRGCPVADRDGDRVFDDVDACVDEPGAPSLDPKTNGCPGLVTIKNGMVVIMQPVFFAAGKDTVLPASFPVLQAVADALTVESDIAHVTIEGHAADRGNAAKDLELSDRRAKSVMRWLVASGIAPTRLDARGVGADRSFTDGKVGRGVASSRRVEFRIGGAAP